MNLTLSRFHFPLSVPVQMSNSCSTLSLRSLVKTKNETKFLVIEIPAAAFSLQAIA
jgi:hypothetical protein